MPIDFTLDKEPVEGVSLIKTLQVNAPKSFEVTEIFVKPLSRSPVDQHQVSEIWQILEGEGTLFFQGEQHHLKQGDWFFFESNQPHQVQNLLEQDLKILSIYWSADAS